MNDKESPMGEMTYDLPLAEYATGDFGRSVYCYDFAEIIFSDDEFIYADPPYVGTFDGYSPGGFTMAQQVELAKKLAAHDGPVMASNSDDQVVIDLYRSLGFDIEMILRKRSISCKGKGRKPVYEMLASKGIA